MNRKETEIQIELVQYFRIKYNTINEPKALIYHIPNGEKRDGFTAKILKRSGVLPGVPDLEILYNGLNYYVEVKTATGVQSKTQENFEDNLNKMNFKNRYFIVRNLEEFKDVLRIIGL